MLIKVYDSTDGIRYISHFEFIKRIHVKIFAAVVTMIIVCFTTACQPTPENLIVQNKGDDDLEQAISVTANPQEGISNTDYISAARANKKGNITVNIEADISIPDVDKLPVVYIEKDDFTQEQVDKMINAFFKDAVLYKTNIHTKTSIENIIISIKQDALNLNSDLALSNDIDNLEDLRKLANEEIAEYQKLWETAPDNRPIMETFDISSNDYVDAVAELGKDSLAYATYSNGDIFLQILFMNFGGIDSRMVRLLETYSSYVLEDTYSSEEFDKAKENALQMIQDMEIEGFILGNVCLSQDQTHGLVDGQETIGVNSDREFYVFCFEREINGMTIDNSFYEGTSSDNTLDATDPRYEHPLPYESLEIWTEGSEIVQFVWESPVKIADIANDNVEVQIDVEQAIDTMAEQLFIQYADMWQGYADSIVINIDEIRLVLARIKEKNTGNYVAVPVWDFYGEVKVEVSKENAEAIGLDNSIYPNDGNMYTINDVDKSIITINSLDGSILDRERF
jgi:hypothetical protein